jgi:hypothetical protein
MAGRENPRDRINPVEVDPALFDDALHRWTDEEKKLPIEERLKIRPKFEKLPYQTPDDEKGLNPDELMQKKIKEMTPLGGDRYFNEEAIQEFDTKSNPRLTYEQPGENLLPPVNKADYWRQKIRIANSKKQSPDENIYKPLLDEYLIDLLTKNERRNSRSAMDFDRTSARGDEGQKRNYDLMKSISDFGASFANRRYSDPNAPIPTSGFEPEGLKKSQDLLAQRMDVMGQKKDQRTGINADVLKYLSEKRAAEIQKAKDEELKREIAKYRAENDPMKALMYGIRQSEENRQKQEFEMKKEKFDTEMKEKKEKAAKEDEFTYRYKNSLKNIDKLEQLINDTEWWQAYPTTEALGNLFSDKKSTKSAEIDGIIYNMALDYAKTVDPDSVAREGEVAAAQKYSLPIQRYLVMGNKQGALDILNKYRSSIDDRAKSMSRANSLPEGNANIPQKSSKYDQLLDLYNKETDPSKKEELKKFMDIESKKMGGGN